MERKEWSLQQTAGKVSLCIYYKDRYEPIIVFESIEEVEKMAQNLLSAAIMVRESNWN